jgi:hypothetical protein
VDYLLLEFTHRETLTSDDFALVSHLPFHKLYEQAEQEIIKVQGKPSPIADDLMIKLQQEIYASPALVFQDRAWLTQIYVAARQKLESSFKREVAGDESDKVGEMLQEREKQVESLEVANLIGAARTALTEARTTERQAPRGKPTTLLEFAAIAKAVRAAAPSDLPAGKLDLADEKHVIVVDAANKALEAASLAFARAALR